MISIRPFSACALLSIALAAPAAPVMAQVNQQRGATFGGLAGAIAGGIIGDHNDEAGAGAAIGGVVGAVAGGILGNAADKEAEMRRRRAAYYHAQQQQRAAQQQTMTLQSAVTLQDVISMSRSGLSDHVIINQVRQRGFAGSIAVSDIISLHQQGVSENVITALQSATASPQPVAPASQPTTVVEQHIHRPGPVIIEEHVVPRYRPHYRRGYFYYYGH
jgi:hypothetical protein